MLETKNMVHEGGRTTRGERRTPKHKMGDLGSERGYENASERGAGFIVHQKHIPDVVDIMAISSKVIHLILRINSIFKIIQTYAPISNSKEKELDQFYDNTDMALKGQRTYYTLLTGGFNSKLQKRQDQP
ncbi:hypothetical protein Trydic_g9628 [Trypoxylus dichotomus]